MAGPFFMSNQFLPDLQLSAPANLSTGTLAMGRSTGLQWYLNDTQTADMKIFSTTHQGSLYCLGTTSQFGGKPYPYLAACDRSPSQQWKLEYQPQPSMFSKISIVSGGETLYLDTYSDNGYVAFLDQGDYTGQYWYTYPVNATTDGMPSQTNMTSGASSVPPSAPSPTGATPAGNSTSPSGTSQASQSQTQSQTGTMPTASASGTGAAAAATPTSAAAATTVASGRAMSFACVILLISSICLSS